MNCKIAVFFLFLSISFHGFALLHFEAKTYEMEGKLITKPPNEIYISINYQSNSETRIKLTGNVPKELYEQHESNALIKFKVARPFISFLGEAEFLELKRYLEPFEKVEIYHEL